MTLLASDFELLLQANRILSSKLDVGEVLQSVMELATKVVKAEASALLLLDEKRNELYFDVALGEAGESVKQIRLKVGEGIAGWVAQKALPLIVNDVQKDSRFTGKVDKSTSFQTKSILAVPLMARGRVIGVVEAINKENSGEFSQEDQEAFEAFAGQAAVSIENARLFSEVKREKEKLNTVFAEMSDGIVFLDEDQKVLIANETAVRFLDLDPRRCFGEKFDARLLKGFEIEPSLEKVQASRDDMVTAEFLRRQAKDFYVSALFRKLHATKELPHGGTLVLVRDVTEERRGEHLKRNFLSLVSHKLKTPLTVILGYGPALLSKAEGLNDFQMKALRAICQQGQELSGLVDKLLRFTIVESESLNRKMESKQIAPILEVALKDISSMRTDRNVDITVDKSVTLMPSVLLDGILTTEVFKNLLENSIKFNDKEAKTVEISAEKSAREVMVHVKDNGVGIPSEEKERVFQKFYQIENSFTGQVPGAGLGLSMCKRVMEEMGGTIQIDSTLGEGTTVSVGFQRK